ncbi:MAG: hypothetical protein ACOYXT_03715 [Bacteroidota bacterium]
MKKWILVLILAMGGCGGSLSDEQRKKMREQMEQHEIKKVTEAQITEAAFAKGREIMSVLEQHKNDSSDADSLGAIYHASIRWITPGAGNAIALEKQLIDAYIAGEAGGTLEDNVQLLRNADAASDSILYTKPVVTKIPDGSERLDGVWNIWLSKKRLILDMDKK